LAEKQRRKRRGIEHSVAEQRRKQIIEAARWCIAEEGVDKLTMRKVAERAQIGHATIAYYFQSRRELIDSALLEMSSEFLVDLQRRRRVNGTRRQEVLLHAFLDADNPTARFVIQMIDAGLHDGDLRRTHDEFVKYGRDSIRQSIQVAIERGELKPDLDADAAAALFHSVLIWWEAEIVAGAESPEDAREVALLLLSLLRPQSEAGGPPPKPTASREFETSMDVIEYALANDPRLSPRASGALVSAIRSMYELAVDAPSGGDEESPMSGREQTDRMTIPLQPFGRTGHQSSRIIFGAAALSRVSQDVADRTLDVLLEHGVNHIDVAASYGDAELRVAPWLRRYPDRFFVATKTAERRAEAAREELERSLERLGVDHVDLWQFHNLSDPVQWDTALSPGGAIDGAVRAREEGLARYIGITGHGTQVAATHRRSLTRFDFDSMLLPYNYLTMQTPYYAENFDALQKVCAERNVAVQTIKSLAYRPWMEGSVQPRPGMSR
jgi:AcrR family transcriptional regulator/diketogulonate reductase-like aldo/keto reductase